MTKIDRTSFPRLSSFRAAGNRPQPRSRFLLLALALGLLTAPLLAQAEPPVISQAERDEIERELAFMDKQLEASSTKSVGTVTCGNDYCRGLYIDLVAYRWEADSGYSGIRIHPDIESYIAASTHGCSSVTSLIMKAAHESSANKNATVSRWVAELIAAQVIGNEIQLRWRQSNFSGWPVCILDRFYTWPPADPVSP